MREPSYTRLSESNNKLHILSNLSSLLKEFKTVLVSISEPEIYAHEHTNMHAHTFAHSTDLCIDYMYVCLPACKCIWVCSTVAQEQWAWSIMPSYPSPRVRFKRRPLLGQVVQINTDYTTDRARCQHNATDQEWPKYLINKTKDEWIKGGRNRTEKRNNKARSETEMST